MIVPAMNSKELFTEIFSDFKIVERKAIYLGLELRREAIKSKTKSVHRVYDYRSKQYNNWVIVIDRYVSELSLSTVVFYLDKFGLNGMRVNADRKSLTHFPPHFLERYNERFLDIINSSKTELLKRFVRMNPLEVIMSVPDEETNQCRIFGRFNEGVGLGYEEPIDDFGGKIYHFKTFISNDMIKDSQEDVFNYVGEQYDIFRIEESKRSRRRA